MSDIDELAWNEAGLVPAIVQDAITQRVLMMAWMNHEALQLTLQSGYAHFWSRSRQQLWRKGEQSGNSMLVAQVRYDCDGDTLLVLAWPQGPACHTGNTSCFYRELSLEGDMAAGAEAAGARQMPAFDWPAEAAEGADE